MTPIVTTQFMLRFVATAAKNDDFGTNVVEDIVQRAAFRWEGVISVGRALFCLTILVRLVGLAVREPDGMSRMGPEAPLLLLLIAFSVWVVLRTRSGKA